MSLRIKESLLPTRPSYSIVPPCSGDKLSKLPSLLLIICTVKSPLRMEQEIISTKNTPDVIRLAYQQLPENTKKATTIKQNPDGNIVNHKH